MSFVSHIFIYLSDNMTLSMAVIGASGIAIGALALLVAVIALIVALAALGRQRRHNIRSVRPLPAIAVTDFEDCLKVEIENNGVGPLLIKSMRVTKERETKPSIAAWMPELPAGMSWTAVLGAIKDRSLAPGGKLTLIELNWDEAEGEIAFADFAIVREVCRGALKGLKVAVSHTDIYGTRMDPYEKVLD